MWKKPGDYEWKVQYGPYNGRYYVSVTPYRLGADGTFQYNGYTTVSLIVDPFCRNYKRVIGKIHPLANGKWRAISEYSDTAADSEYLQTLESWVIEQCENALVNAINSAQAG